MAAKAHKGEVTATLAIPALHATHAGIWIADAKGEVRSVSRGEAVARAAETPHILLNAPLVGQRLGYPELSGLDLLELFAFVHPARFAVPTVTGLARAVGLEVADGELGATMAQRQIAGALLETLSSPDWAEREGAWTVGLALQRAGWGWAPLIGARLDAPGQMEKSLFSRLEEWEETGEILSPRTVSVDPEDAKAVLAKLVGKGAEAREGQRDMLHLMVAESPAEALPEPSSKTGSWSCAEDGQAADSPLCGWAARHDGRHLDGPGA